MRLGDTTTIIATMPPLPPSACSSSQTYIAPGNAFPPGGGYIGITSTGACIDNSRLAATGGISGIPTWVLLAGGALLLFMLVRN